MALASLHAIGPDSSGLFSCCFCSRRGRLRLTCKRLFLTTRRRQADFIFCGKRNGISFPYSSGRIHFVVLFLKLAGTKNSMIIAIHHPTLVKTGLRQESSGFDKSLQMRIVASDSRFGTRDRWSGGEIFPLTRQICSLSSRNSRAVQQATSQTCTK